MISLNEELDLYLMANLSTRLTGLPFVVWISQRGNAQHDIRVKVSPGPKAIPEEMVSVALRPSVRVVSGTMDRRDFDLLAEWIDLNLDVLIEYWDGTLLTDEALERLRGVSAQ